MLNNEALLVSLNHQVDANTEAFAKSARILESSHDELLEGRISAITSGDVSDRLFPDRTFPRTNLACTLTTMMYVLKFFGDMKNALMPVINKAFEETEPEIAALVQGFSSRNQASARMQTATTFYTNGAAQCSSTLSKAEWESGIQLSGQAGQMFEEAQKNFVLIASGLAETWIQQANDVSNQGNLLEEIRESFRPSTVR